MIDVRHDGDVAQLMTDRGQAKAPGARWPWASSWSRTGPVYPVNGARIWRAGVGGAATEAHHHPLVAGRVERLRRCRG